MKGDWTTIDPDNQLHINSPPFFLGPYWDAIPADGNAAFPMGLSRDVRLVSSGLAAIDDLFVSTKAIDAQKSATLAISGTVMNYGRRGVSVRLNSTISPENFAGQPVYLPTKTLSLLPGENQFAFETEVKNPHLWWTWDLGQPNLYRISFRISSPTDNRSDSHDSVFGIRSVTIKSDMSYWLNGKRLFLKGAWYPMSDYYGSKPTQETFVKDLELFRAANLNHLVAFTVVEKPDFYDLCDRLGILVIFEFPFNQDGPIDVLSYSNPRREAFVKESLSQVRQIILGLRKHPSIIEWAAFAEAHAKGGKWGVGSWDFEQYGYGPYSDAIGKLVEDLDPGTIYHPSLCDMGEQHFWMGNAGMGTMGSYIEHSYAQTGLVSEYGSLSLPTLNSLKKELSAEDLWADQNSSLRRWYNLPINISAYSYLSSFDYDGLASLLSRVDQYVDRHIKSIRDLVDDSELYQAFLLKYATEAYRRRKYDPINGTRIWDYGEVWPGIRWGIIDYFRVPKMSYYYLKKAQSQFALNFAYEDALESQVSGKRVRIPAWVISDHSHDVAVELTCRIHDLEDRTLWEKNFDAIVPLDGKKQMGVVEWVAPATPGVYVLSGQATGKENGLSASNSTFIKVTPRLFARNLNLLLIGQRKYSLPIAEMVRGMGVNVDVIDEQSLPELERLTNAEEIRKRYDVVWLSSFDSLWKLLNDTETNGLKSAVSAGVGFIHTGGRGSYHGGFGEGACLDLTPLADILPVKPLSRYDLVLAQANEPTEMFSNFGPINDIHLIAQTEPGWSDGGLRAVGIPGFNDTELKEGTNEILAIEGRPLLVTGRYGQGRTVAFTGFTPGYRERHAEWDAKVVYPYLLDHQLYEDPKTRAYFYVFLELIAAATGEKPQTSYEQFLAAREKPLFETLKDLPTAEVKVPREVQGEASGNRANFSVKLTNTDQYARLVRLSMKWEGEEAEVPYLEVYNDNYFDLLPEESKTVDVKLWLPMKNTRGILGNLIVEGSNVPAKQIAVKVQTKPGP